MKTLRFKVVLIHRCVHNFPFLAVVLILLPALLVDLVYAIASDFPKATPVSS